MAQDKYSQNRQLAYDLLKQEGYTDIGDSAEELFKNKANAELAYKLLTDAGYTDLGADYNEFAGMLYAPEPATSITPQPSSMGAKTERDSQAAAEGRSMFNQMVASRRGTSSLSDAPQATQDYLNRPLSKEDKDKYTGKAGPSMDEMYLGAEQMKQQALNAAEKYQEAVENPKLARFNELIDKAQSTKLMSADEYKEMNDLYSDPEVNPMAQLKAAIARRNFNNSPEGEFARLSQQLTKLDKNSKEYEAVEKAWKESEFHKTKSEGLKKSVAELAEKTRESLGMDSSLYTTWFKMMMRNPATNRGVLPDTHVKDTQAATSRMLAEAAKILNDPSKYDDTTWLQRRGRFAKEYGKEMVNPEMWLKSLFQAEDALPLRNVFGKIAEHYGNVDERLLKDDDIDNILDEDEKNLLRAYFMLSEAQTLRPEVADYIQSARSAANSTKFIIEMAISGEALGFNALEKKLYDEGAKKLAATYLAKWAEKQIVWDGTFALAAKAGQAVTKLAGKSLLTYATSYPAVLFHPTTWGDFAERMSRPNEDGKYDPDALKEAWGAIRDQQKERWTETLGETVFNEFLGSAVRGLGLAGRKALGNGLAGKMADEAAYRFSDIGDYISSTKPAQFIKKAANSSWGQKVRQIAEATHFDGIGPEIGEEALGAAIDAFRQKSAEPLRDFFTWDNLIMTGESFLPMYIWGGGFSAAGLAASRIKYGHSSKRLENLMKKYGYSDEQVQYIFDQTKGAAPSEISKLLADMGANITNSRFGAAAAVVMDDEQVEIVNAFKDYLRDSVEYNTYDAMREEEEAGQREVLKRQLEDNYGHKFYIDADDNNPQRVVRARVNDGKGGLADVFILDDKPGINGKYYAMYPDGQMGWVGVEDMAPMTDEAGNPVLDQLGKFIPSYQVQTLDAFLSEQVMAQRQTETAVDNTNRLLAANATLMESVKQIEDNLKHNGKDGYLVRSDESGAEFRPFDDDGKPGEFVPWAQLAIENGITTADAPIPTAEDEVEAEGESMAQAVISRRNIAEIVNLVGENSYTIEQDGKTYRLIYALPGSVDAVEGRITGVFAGPNGERRAFSFAYDDVLNPRFEGEGDGVEPPAAPKTEPEPTPAPAAEEAPEIKETKDYYQGPGSSVEVMLGDLYGNEYLKAEEVDKEIMKEHARAKKALENAKKALEDANPETIEQKDGESLPALAARRKKAAEDFEKVRGKLEENLNAAENEFTFWEQAKQIVDEDIAERKEEAKREQKRQADMATYGVDISTLHDLDTPLSLEEAVAEYLGNSTHLINAADAEKEWLGKGNTNAGEIWRHRGPHGILSLNGGQTVRAVAEDIVGEYESLNLDEQAVFDEILNQLDTHTKTEMRDVIFQNRLKEAIDAKNAAENAPDANEQQNGASEETTAISRDAEGWLLGNNGEPLVLEHGTNADFDGFEFGHETAGGVKSPQRAFFFSVEGEGGKYGKRAIKVNLKMRNPLITDNHNIITSLTQSEVNELKQQGYDGVILMRDGKIDGLSEFAVFETNQIRVLDSGIPAEEAVEEAPEGTAVPEVEEPVAEPAEPETTTAEEETPAEPQAQASTVQQHPAYLRAAYESGNAEQIAAAEKAMSDFINSSDSILLLRGTENVAKDRREKADKGSAEYKLQDFILKAIKKRIGQFDKAAVKAFDDARAVYEDRFTAEKDALESAIAYFRGELETAQELLDNVPEGANELYVANLKNRVSSAKRYLDALTQELNRFNEEEEEEEKEPKVKNEPEAEVKEPEKPAEKPAQKAAKASTDEKIEDFGEKIGGARKDTYRAKIRDAVKLTAKDLSTLKDPDKILSRKKIISLMEEGAMSKEDGLTLLSLNMAVRSLSDMLGMKTLGLMKYRDLASAWEAGKELKMEITDADIDFLIEQKSDRVKALPNIREKERTSLEVLFQRVYNDYRATYEALNYPAVNRALKSAYIRYGRADGRYWVVGNPSARRGWPCPTMEQAVAKMEAEYPEIKKTENSSSSTEKGDEDKVGNLLVVKDDLGYYRVKSRSIPGKIYLSKKFYSRKDAEQFLKDNAASLVDREQKMVDALLGSNIGMVQREGRDYRNGKDVTPDQMLETFGFRGVEFGNWVPQAERQEYLNKTYDAIMDFCDIVGISPKAFSLGGRLGLAFGARGHSRALAHYEPMKEVINLTRMKGAGSLAHEWFHALDNYLAKQKTGNTSDMATDTKNVVREEMAQAFRDFVGAMNQLDYSKRSRRAGDYWGEVWERAARLFESYVYNELASKSVVSPLLVSKDTLFDDVQSEDNSASSWPYPSIAENEYMKPFFDKLFDTIEEKVGEDGNVLLFRGGEETEDIFLSNAEQAVGRIKMDKATPEQWLKMIEKEGGLKAGEDKWIGLSDWLKASDKKTLTKQEVLDYINRNKIVVEEQHYAAMNRTDTNEQRFFQFAVKLTDEMLRIKRTYNIPQEEAYKEVLSRYGEGADNYLQMDSMGLIRPIPYIDPVEALKFFEQEVNENEVRPIDSIRLDYTTSGLDNYREIALTVPSIQPWNEDDDVHFGDAGGGRAVAWVRFGETTDAAGHRVLVIDEVQSKRHQDGRTKGYADDAEFDPMQDERYRTRKEEVDRKKYALEHRQEDRARKDELDAEIQRMYVVLGQARNAEEYHAASDELKQYEDERFEVINRLRVSRAETERAEQNLKYFELDLRNEARRRNYGKPFKAPFASNWHELAMKRMLRLAAEEGYDYVAWTTGEQQAERYSLSKVLSGVETVDNHDGTRNVYLNQDGAPDIELHVNSEGTVTGVGNRYHQEYVGKKLSDIIGKELASRTMSTDTDEVGNAVTVAEGTELRIGGEGMKGFYDEIIPRYMNKYGKKWGVSVNGIELPVGEEGKTIMHSIPVTPEMKASVMQGLPMFREGSAEERRISAAELEATSATLDRMSEEMGIKINRVGRSEMPRGHKSDKGYYNPSTGEMTICMDNVTDERDAIATVLHETVGHHGLRKLFGDRFNDAMARIYAALDQKGKTWVNGYIARHPNADNTRAVEEYLSHLAESGNFKNTVWDNIRRIIGRIVDALFGTNGFLLTDNELNYILRASYENLKNPNWLNTVEGRAFDTLLKRQLGINETDPNKPTDPQGPDAGRLYRDGDTGIANDDYNREVDRKWNKALTENQDADRPVKIGMDKVMNEKGIKSISEDEDYVTRHNLASSRAESEAHEFELFRFTPLMDQVRAIQSRLLGKKATAADREQAYQRILDYMYAVSGLERNASKNAEIEQAKQAKLADAAAAGITDQAKLAEIEKKYDDMKRDWSGLTSLMGMSKDNWQAAETAAQGMISAFERAIGDKAALDELWNRVRACTDFSLEHAYQHGLLTREEFERLHGTASQPRMWDFYLPLRGFSETTTEEQFGYETFTNPSRGNVVVKKMNGRWTQADNPLANILNIAETEIVQGNDNWAKQALYRFTLNAGENTLLTTSEPWFVKNPATGKWSMAFPDPGETLEEFEERMKALRALDDPLAKKGRRGLKLENIVANKAHRNEHAIHLKVGGIDKMIWVNGNPALAKAVSGIGRALNWQWLRRASRALSNLFTTYSLDFTAKNLIRDTVYSNIALHVKEDKAYRHQYYKNWVSNFGYGAFAFPMVRLAAEWDSGKLQQKEKAGTLTKRERDFLNFMRDGGQTGYTIINSVNQIKKDLEKQMRSAGGRPGTVPILGWYAKAVKTLNEGFELLTRFTAYQTSRDMGRSGQRAASDAKEISVNFNRRGAQSGQGIWGNIAAYLGATHYFYNAGVQGFDNFLGLFKKKPVKMSAITAGFVMMGVLTPLINGMLAGLIGGGDGDDDWYWNLPEWVRRNNLVIGTGKWYVSLPLPVEFRAPYGIGDIAGAAFAYDKYPNRHFGNVAGDLVSTASGILPVNPIEGYTGNGNLGDAALRAVAPDAGMFFVDWATNRDYTGRPLWKENPFSDTVPKSQGAYASTPKGIVAACQKLAEVSNGSIDIAPGVVRDFMNNYGGGFFRAAEDVSKLLFTDEERPRRWDNVPFFSGFTGHIDEDRSNSFAQGALYDYKKLSEDNVKSMNAILNTDDVTSAVLYDEPESLYEREGVTVLQKAKIKRMLDSKDYALGKMYREGMNNKYKMKQSLKDGHWYKSREIERKGVNALRQEWKDLRDQWAKMPEKTEEQKSAKAEMDLKVQEAWHLYYDAMGDLAETLLDYEYNK